MAASLKIQNTQNVFGKSYISNPLMLRCGPHCHASKISGDILEDEFHEMFRGNAPEDSKKKLDKKKLKKKKVSRIKDKKRTKSDTAENSSQQTPFLEIRSNPSSFAVFACVRQCVLDKQIRESAQLFLRTSSGRVTDSESDDEDDRSKDSILKVPKIVGIGLCSVFELIRESRKKHPALCTRSLQALLDMLQGQQPEGLKHEPPDVIDTLFDLLLDIASGQNSSTSASSSSEYGYIASATSLTSYACACLLSLVIARGDTGKLLSAAAAMLMSPAPLVTEEIPTPGILTSLQRSIHAVLLGKTQRPDWLSQGISKSSNCDTFSVQIPKCKPSSCCSSSIACDGKYLYILSGNTIYKVGSGYAGTVKGQIVLCRGGLKVDGRGWLGYAKGFLYYQPLSASSTDLIKIDPDNLKELEPVQLDAPDCGPSGCFTDGEYVGLITAGKDDSFVIRTFKSVISPMPCVHELTLKLARKCMDVFGSGVFDEELTFHSVSLPINEDEPMCIASGKDFALLRTVTGKMLFAGKSQSLGIKQTVRVGSKWAELPITKSPKISQFSIGHDGQHSLLIGEDGSVFFTGLARRGEDGDQTKGRRQPKPVKPKKMIKMEGHRIVHSACNNGTSALVTQEGELYLFGKDTAHSDHNSGLVTDLKEVVVTQVALGKAHVVVLNNKGQVFTFGINHKGQCGREYSHSTSMKEVALPIAMATAPEEEGEDEDLESEEPDIICAPGKHRWKHDQCMVCTLCGECTGYGAGCIASGRPDRNPGLPCGCGAGDSGCAECGCCRMCSRENDQEVELADWSQLAAAGGAMLDNKQSDVIVFDIRYGGRGVARLEDRVRRRMEEYRLIRQRRKQMLQSLKVTLKGQSPRVVSKGDAQDKASVVSSVDDAAGSDHEKEATKLTSLSPGRLYPPTESPIIQVCCGMHHTVLLMENGEVYTFGSNQHGQLGHGDFLVRGTPTLVKLSVAVTQIATGSNHTVLLSAQGQVYTCGNYQRGQLGRHPLPTISEEASRKERGKEGVWQSSPGLIEKIGGKNGRRATWIGATGDQTFVKVDETLINSHNLARANIIANRHCVGILPNNSDQVSPFRCVMINKVDGTCRSFNSMDQVELSDCATCLDSVYNIVWSFCPATQLITRYNVIGSEARSFSSPSVVLPLQEGSLSESDYVLPNMLSPEMAVPMSAGSKVTRSHAALHLLGCLDLLTSAAEQGLVVHDEEEEKQSVNKVYSKEDFSVVNRFESHGGGWGYSGHSIEAIRFMADTDILLGGFGLFGGRGEYTAKLKLLDIGVEGGDQETDGELLAETEEIPYECGPRQKFPMLFDEPVPLQANRWYVTWCRISGPSSDCGSSGQSVVTTEDQVVFYFKSSNKSNNGTDVNAGQLPQLLYRVITPDNRTSFKPSNQLEAISILSNDFSRKVVPDCFLALVKLLRWSWQTFKANLCELAHSILQPPLATILDMERLMIISISSLHLLRIYINEIYPNGPMPRKMASESPKLAESIGDVRVLLRHILSDPIPLAPFPTRQQSAASTPLNTTPHPVLTRMLNTVLDECQQTFLSCYHAFYPNSALKWKGLCDLLLTVDVPWACASADGDHLLAAVLASLCSPAIRLTSILPITMEQDLAPTSEAALQSPVEPNIDGGETSQPISRTTSGQEMGQYAENYRYPVLVEAMTLRTEREGCHSGPYSFKSVLDHLLAAVIQPVKAQLRQETITHSPKLVANTCALLATIIAELSSQTIGTVLDIQGTGGQVLHMTSSRFARVSQNRTWNTGNGSPDAICFSVDRPGILIKGVCVYGGGGNERHYELELLDDQSVGSNDPSHTQRWKTLEIVRGSFGPDDCYGDAAEIIFQRNIAIKENVKYAIRLRNHGDRTNNGDGGLTQIKGPDGTTFTFSDCSLSFNGTNHTRGQIPQILYFSTPQDTEIQQSYRDLAELQARRNALAIGTSIVRAAAEILMEAQAEEDLDILATLGSSHLVTMLLPLVFSHMGPLATSDPRSAVQVLCMVRDLLPLVAALNRRGLKTFSIHKPEIICDITNASTTSQHYTVAESDHPYRPATVSNYKVKFPNSVRWMALEFDSQCGTAQAEDSLQLYIPCQGSEKGIHIPAITIKNVSTSATLTNSVNAPDDDDESYTPYWPILRKFSGSVDWPHSAIILPGNEVVFSLETASDYVKDEKSCFYGFRCQLVGFECPQLGNNAAKESRNFTFSSEIGWEGLAHLERELAYLGGMCSASLVRKDLLLPPASVSEVDEDLDLIEDLAQQVYNSHSELLCKGFALAHPPSVQQALEGALPFSSQSNERSFLKDFVSCTAGSSGGRLARWLQPEPYVDPKQCELLCSQEELKCGWPAVITVITKDQYGKVVYSPFLKVEVRAVPLTAYDKDGSDANRKLLKVSKPDTGSLTCFGGHPPPSLDTAYEITVKDKMFYYAITMMKPYENYSFEELRYVSPTKKRLIENMLVRSNNDGTYVANWTPGSVGWYLLNASIDGFEIGESQLRSVEVKEPPQGLIMPSKSTSQKSAHQPSKLRKFVVRYSAGLRIRTHPSLQSEQVGVVHVNGTIAFIDELHNDDGVWVRLSPETVKKYCHNGYTEAWCLQYNQHLGKTLLVPVEEPKSILAEFFRDVGHFLKKKPSGDDSLKDFSRHKRGPGVYHVVLCGASGHNIRSRPSLKSPPVGMLVLGNSIGVMEDAVNADGTWVRLDKDTMQRFCFNSDGEAWSLAQSRSDVVYLQHEAEMMQAGDSDDDQSGAFPICTRRGSDSNILFGVSSNNHAFSSVPIMRKGYDFAASAIPPPIAVNGFGQSPGQQSGPGLFTFGSGTSDQEGGSSGTTSPFIFGSPASTPSTSMNTIAESERTETDKSEKDSLSSSGGRVAALQKWLREESTSRNNLDYCGSSLSRDIPPELTGVSVKELVKAIGESRFNGNAATPPQTPPGTPQTPRRQSRCNSPKTAVGVGTDTNKESSCASRAVYAGSVASSSPVPVPIRTMSVGPTCTAHYDALGSPKGFGSSPRQHLQDGWSPIHRPSTGTPKSTISSGASVRRNSIQSDTSVGSHFSSILRELSQSSATGCIGCITQRNTISPISTPGTPGTPATPGTPKKEVCASKTVTQTGTQTSPDSNVKGHFSIGTSGNKEEPLRLSPKMARKDRASRQLRSKRDRSHSPSPHHHHHHHHHHHAQESNAKEKSTNKDQVKEAMSPSVAECLRAVFAAFLWHEGLVYDAMACASFLKFNPNIPKNSARITTKPVVMREKSELAMSMTREQRARLRHSVEVTPGLMNLHPSTIEQIWSAPLNANIIQSKVGKKAVSIREENPIDSTVLKRHATTSEGDINTTAGRTAQPPKNSEDSKPCFESNDQLPQSLQYLVFLWEQISTASLKVIVQQLILPSLTNGSKMHHRIEKERGERDKDRRLKKRKDYRQVVVARSHLFGEAGGAPAGPERETICELCGQFYSHPVTYHMRQAHPGCGDPAGGKGYNSSGNFCGGWAGNCGDGGIGGSSWYLICDPCREKYMRQKRQNIMRDRAKKSRKKTGSAASRLLSPLPPLEPHQVMKNNAMFLLELSSATRSGLPSNIAISSNNPSSSSTLRRSVFGGMPSLQEQGDMLENNPFPVGPFQCLDALGVQQEYNNILGQEFLSEDDIRALQIGAEATSMVASADSAAFGAQGILRSMTMNGDSNGMPPSSSKSERRRSRGSRENSLPGNRSFHRSISVGLTSKEWNKQDGEGLLEGRVVMMRKRNSSGSEDGSSSFLCQPSAVLTKLVNMAMEKPVVDFPLQRPVMIFMLQQHDLERLQLAMKQALRKAACRVYGMQALNWLLRSVTHPISLHDLLWCFVAALAPSPIERREEEPEVGPDEEVKEKKDQEMVNEQDLNVWEHPLSEITIAGEAVHPLPQTFHSLLQTISDLMMLLPVGSALQQMAMKCWCLKFLPADHSFLHHSHVFSNISKILSRSEEEGEEPSSSVTENEKVVSTVEGMKDLTSTMEIKASSRQAMVSSLTDNSTETFWESGDDDRNKSKMLVLTFTPQSKPKVVYVHIDNCRDLGNKVSLIIFRSGPTAEELQKLKQAEVENRFTGWISCFIPSLTHNTIRLELKGPDNTLRLRQVRVLGQIGSESLAIGKHLSSSRVQQKNCEAETLKVFRLLTSQVFGKLIVGETENIVKKKEDSVEGSGDGLAINQTGVLSGMETSNDLKEHMVGILFSRSKLTHLQKQVCTHIVAAIRKEALRVREEWEALLCSKNVQEMPKSSDAYCFEMLSMVLALSGSSVGRSYLAQQAGLLKDLFSLLHTGSARVQRQVTSLLRRVLPNVTPQMLASILGVPALPPTDFSIVSGLSQSPGPSNASTSNNTEQPFDLHRMGILDVFLSCIAKALTVQTKVKGGTTATGKGVTMVTLATSIHPRDYIGTRWWLRGCMVRKLAEVIIQLLKDMAAGKLTEAWATVTKSAIAENILNLTKLDENLRSPSECLRTPSLWLSLASLCVLDQDHVERLSSGQWAGAVDGQQALPRPTCDNHDDAETLAIILCSECGNLCADCDRFLHLHRKTRLHQRQVFKEEEEAIRVDLHEGCGRTKLFWIMALADSKTLKAMVEFREGARGKSSTSSGVCRFCGASGSSGLLAIGNVCAEPECQEHARNACTKLLACGHSCGGMSTETCCLPCLHGCGGVSSGLKQDADDMCMICFTEALACAPAILLNCGHVFHLHCCRAVLQKRWSGPRITFGFSLCPICKANMEHVVLRDLLDPIRSLYEDVKRKAQMRLEYEGLLKAEAVATPGARFYKDPASFAMERYAYYVCFKCKKAYYGGEARCDIDAGPSEGYDPSELVCGACSDVSRAQMCPKHGTDFLEYKCRYCCSVAVFFCFGTTHFCNACHDDFQRVTNIPKQELPHCPAGPKAKQLEIEECPLHVKHPATGEEFALGCGVCRNAHTF